jgi:hypothetical protein
MPGNILFQQLAQTVTVPHINPQFFINAGGRS